jgi:hypothetical protein
MRMRPKRRARYTNGFPSFGREMNTDAQRLIPSMKKKVANAKKRKSFVSLQNLIKKTLAVNEAMEMAPSKKASNIYLLSHMSPNTSKAVAMAAIPSRMW